MHRAAMRDVVDVEEMKILEISRSGFFKALQPDNTCWVRWGEPLTVDEPHQPDGIGLWRLVKILRRVREGTYDLVILLAIHPQHRFDEPWHKLIAKSVLRNAVRLPISAVIPDHLVGTTPHIIIDIADHRSVCDTT